MRDIALGWIIVGVLIALLALPFLLLAGDQAWFGDKRTTTIDPPHCSFAGCRYRGGSSYGRNEGGKERTYGFSRAATARTKVS